MNTNEEMKMKKISYFGKEYAVSDDVKWVATNSYGTAMAFRYEPIPTGSGWAGGVYEALARFPTGSIDWQNSLRKVEDILVKENKLKVGDKVMVNDDTCGFKKGQIVEVYKLNNNGIHLFKGDNSYFCFCDDEEGAYLQDYNYDIIEDATIPSGHPHADLMLKYAMIAQYDDKPWEYFECDVGGGGWVEMIDSLFHVGYNYRLKPQGPKIQIGQTWVSEEGVEVMVDTPSDINTIYFRYHLGGLLIKNAVSFTHFIKHFKRKE